MDRNRFDAVWPEHRGRLQAYAFHILRDAAMAEDVVSEVYLKTARKVDTLRDASYLRLYLYKAVRNLINDERAKMNRFAFSLDADPNDEDRCAFLSHEDEHSFSPTIDTLKAAGLTDRDVDMLTLRAHGLDAAEHAGLKGLTIPAFKSRLYRVRNRAQGILTNA